MIISDDGTIVFSGQQKKMPVYNLDFKGVKFTKGEYWLLAYPDWSEKTNINANLTVAIDGGGVKHFEGASYEDGM